MDHDPPTSRKNPDDSVARNWPAAPRVGHAHALNAPNRQRLAPCDLFSRGIRRQLPRDDHRQATADANIGQQFIPVFKPDALEQMNFLIGPKAGFKAHGL